MSRLRFPCAWCIVVLLAPPLVAELVVVYDPADPVVPNRVLSAQYRHPCLPGTSTLIPNALFAPEVSALAGVPVTQWKRVGSTVVAMSQAELDAIAAAAQAAREAQALAAYGQARYDLVDGDAIIGQCAGGEILSSPRFEAAVLDVIKRRLSVEDGEYLVRDGAQIVGSPARVRGGRAEVAAGARWLAL